MITLESYVCGRWQHGSGTPRLLYNPSTEATMAASDSTGVDFAAVVAHARERGGPALRELGFARRAELLKTLSAALHGHREELIELSVQNGGNTRGDAKFDIDGAIGTLAAYAELGKELGDGNHLPDGEGVQLGRSPRFWGQHMWVTRPGITVHINAFNFPCWGMGEKLAQALLAGVPVITKPGTPTALLAWRAAQLMVETGALPEGAFQLICGETGDLLAQLGPMDSLSFTGSSGVGAKLKATPNLVQRNVRVNIEADSLNAAILGPDVGEGDEAFAQFLGNVVTDITQKAGQKCTAVRRVLVPEESLNRVVDELVARLRAIKVGDPADDNNRMGPVASESQLRDVRAGIAALAAHCSVSCGGVESIAERGYFVAPTLLVAADPHAAVVHGDEVFGPVATVVPYSGNAPHAIELANRGGGCLVTSVYSNETRWTEQVVLGIAPWHGRVWIGSDKTAGQAFPPGGVLPLTVHGGPGRAGGGEELGGRRGLQFYMQRTAVQGFQGMVSRSFG
ncbi:MAG: 3,4-dehydroadipyl-CoA semialdehyde dehydrogenase [Planctomycetes bacterium]|nr:3,4-dehydroadipyl-CoA semialdehyde dehydrogenase [Planctomycetota bacterium]MCB9871031.1 3,4-dehydroadipyl-CoA semialdehyde dehydrogenase [Planctomycetota bacterium]